MDIGCTFPTTEHLPAFLETCKQLGLHTVAFRGAGTNPSPQQLSAVEALSAQQHGHKLKCLRRADLRLSGDDAVATLAKKLTVSVSGGNNTNNANTVVASPSSSSYIPFEDCDLLVLHLDSHSDVSMLGNTDFGALLTASQNAVAKRRGPSSRLIVINLDCFVTASPSPLKNSNNNSSSSQSIAMLTPAVAKSFAMCKALSKCPDVVFELSYLPWVRAHARGGGELFGVSAHLMDCYDRSVASYEEYLANMANKHSDNPNVTTMGPPPPPVEPIPMIASLRSVAAEIVAAFMKPLLLSSGQIVQQQQIGEDNNGTSSSSSATTIASDLLFMRAPMDIHALANTLLQLRRPLLEQGLATMRRLRKLECIGGIQQQNPSSSSDVGLRNKNQKQPQQAKASKRAREE